MSARVSAYSLVPVALVCIAAPASSQNNGLPSQQQSTILMEVIADRGEACGLLRPWQSESIRMQTRELIERLDPEARATVALEIETRRTAMACDDGLLTNWTEAAAPNMEIEYLPELLPGYRAFALQDDRPAAFDEATGRQSYDDVVAQIDAKLEALAADGVEPPGGMSWSALHERQIAAAAEISAAIAGEGSGRYTPEQAERLVRDIATITELWLTEDA